MTAKNQTMTDLVLDINNLVVSLGKKPGGQRNNDGSDIDSSPQSPQNPSGNNGGNNDNGGNNGGGDPGGDNGGTDQPPVNVPPLPSTQVDPVDDVLSLADAIIQCTLDGVSKLDLKAWNACIKDYTT